MHPTLGYADYGFRHQDQVARALPPLDFGWERNECERPYDIGTLYFLYQVFSGEAMVLDKENETLRCQRALLENTDQNEQQSLVQHISPVIGQHEVPELVS